MSIRKLAAKIGRLRKSRELAEAMMRDHFTQLKAERDNLEYLFTNTPEPVNTYYSYALRTMGITDITRLD